MTRIGLIAGNGRFPLYFADYARKGGHCVVAVAIREETSPDLENLVDEIHWFHVGELQGMIDIFLKQGINQIVMAGKITKTRMFNHLKPDARLLKVFEKTPVRNDDALLKALAGEFIAEGIHVCDSTTFLSSLLPTKGTITKRAPTDSELLDIKYGYEIAKQIAGLDIGQTVVVKNCAILAVEAIEGTDEAILRGSKLGNGQVTVVKVARPRQDMRFDLPVIGLDTIRTLIKAQARCLAVEEQKTLLLDRDESVAMANEAGLSIVVI
ncbi:MAG: UDP-2,3-diacylglucosamine diphosphatase LpxI [Candidatus Riflebacteria bacterium]|nr:UDP-2,3-diacylglucosamine diphosphatase LpxI [Candidatus Riflebacteria bacterium]